MKILTDTGLLAFWNKIKQLVLGNRPYEPTEFSGKGYKVLEKNIQTVNGVKKNILTAVMINQPNTIYEIRYDFDLDGATIVVKEGCTLKFEGGSLKNGTLTFDYVSIEGGVCQLFSNINFNGYIKSKLVLPEWFGAKGDGSTDDTLPFQQALDLGKSVAAYNNYKVSSINCHYGTELYIPKQLEGNLNITHGRCNIRLNRLKGTLKIGSTTNSCAHNIINFNIIYTPDNSDGIVLDGSVYGVQNTIIYGGVITNNNVSENKLYNYGVHMIARKTYNSDGITENSNSFCNQNMFFGIVAYNAKYAGLFMDNTDYGKYAPARMNGNAFYSFDCEGSDLAIKMSSCCVNNKFFSLRNNEISKEQLLLEFGGRCSENEFYTTQAVFSSNFKYRKDQDAENIGGINIIRNGLKAENNSRIWKNDTYISFSEEGDEISFFPISKLSEKLNVLSKDTVISTMEHSARTNANTTIFNGNYRLFLNNNYGAGKIDNLSVYAKKGEVPTRIYLPYKNYKLRTFLLDDKVELNITKAKEYHTIKQIDINGIENKKIFINLGNITKSSESGRDLKLQLLECDKTGSILRQMNLSANNRVLFSTNSSNTSYIIIRGFIEGVNSEKITYNVEVKEVLTNIALFLNLSESAVLEDTLYNIHFTNNKCLIEDKKVNIKDVL